MSRKKKNFDPRPPEPAIRSTQEVHDVIAACAREMAGTDFDLDEDLEMAGIEHMLAADL